MALTGRIDAAPAQIWHEEVLEPQFAREASDLLPWYVAIEKVLLLEYVRMGLCDAPHASALGARLDELRADRIAADPVANMSDIAFAVERHVTGGPITPFSAWHVDRSRNDLQACAQLLAAREYLLAAVDQLGGLGRVALTLAEQAADTPMPGATHLQPAQVISPGFWLTALTTETLLTLRRLQATYAEVDLCPLGAGAMAGQELAWHRQRLADLLGFAGPTPHALVAVAGRGWALSIAGDLGAYGVTLSRFVTDLMTWGSGDVGFLDLPDDLAGISSAMPQKKNFPILERIRGRSAHLLALGLDLAVGQRSTPYTNMVEVSKEAGTHLRDLFDVLRSTLRLLTTVLSHARLRSDRMRAACERDYLGGFSLANRITLAGGVPWRASQVIAGRYIVAALEQGRPPTCPDGDLLATLLADEGYAVADPTGLLVEALDVEAALHGKQSPGSTHPDAVRRLVIEQRAAFGGIADWAAGRRATVSTALSRVDAELAEPREHSHAL